ncbi:uncharacterized protein LOC117651888 [Thrips palmi]|uniref:Uncharacterized protein LOC117651888 n=1 Tax=Thrips palmi TaxID=161013 RepID=A0A6P9A4B9_THRPL|nr:uncharacterized protein LOC117651888 [Thrips palmi]
MGGRRLQPAPWGAAILAPFSSSALVGPYGLTTRARTTKDVTLNANEPLDYTLGESHVNTTAGSAEAATVRISVRKDLHSDCAQGPLLPTAAPCPLHAAPCPLPAAPCPPPAPAAEQVKLCKCGGKDRTIGWCTFPHCDRPFRSWEDHFEHQKACHIDRAQANATCPLCLEVVDQRVGVPYHCLVYHQRDEACPHCCARPIKDLSSHLTEFHHAKSDGLVAPELGWCPRSGCDSSFSSWSDFVRHTAHSHDVAVSDRALVCQLCLRVQRSPKALKRHSDKHFDTQKEHFLCDICPARYFKQKRLSQHMNVFHRK